MKRTPWFPVSVPPVHDGLYETRVDRHSLVILRAWDGKRWSLPDYPLTIFGRGLTVGNQWRGLAAKPKEG